MKLALRLLTLLLAPAPLSAAYNYWFTTQFAWVFNNSGSTSPTWQVVSEFPPHSVTNWQLNGPLPSGHFGFNPNSTPGTSLILNTPTPDNTSSYEIRSRLRLPSSGGSYILYLRATPNARLNPNGVPTGNFFAFEIKDPTYANGACRATLNTWRALNNTLTQLATTTIPCYDGMEVRAVSATQGIRFYLDDVFYVSHPETILTTGQPGIGGFNLPFGNAFRQLDLGLLDRVAPTLAPASIATAVFDTRVELQWSPADDGPDGIGTIGYHFFRDGAYLGFRRGAEAVDLTVQPNTTYTYELQPEDFHRNMGPRTPLTVRTPPAGHRDPRRTGVRPLGTYWGGLGEQIDLQSGNVNFAMPLFKAQARGGWGVTFALTYNSQNWRRDTANLPRTWNHGRDIGYGYGWRFLAGALTPLYTDYRTIGMYRFLDASGAEYRLTETAPNSGEWTTREGLFLTYKSNEERLYFPDGAWWQFGAIAGASEMDAGTRYPTLFQDRNGNQIQVRYRPARGATQPNSSGRLTEVDDVRGNTVYRCEYVNDPLQHLNLCRGIDANYQVGIGAPTPLTDPFLGQSFGEKQLLGGITNITDNINAPFYFGYDNGATSGPGELTAAVFPYGGSLHWSYTTGTLAAGRQFRRASARAYNANDGQGGKWAYLHFYPGPNAELPVHEWTVLQDPTFTADKAWWWDSNLGSPTMGLNRDQADRKMPSYQNVAYRNLAWSLTPNGNPYIAAVTETVDPGHPDAKIRRTEQAINDYGNLLWKREYALGSTTTIAREHVYTYETAPAYTNKFIRNLVRTVTLKRPGEADLLVLNNFYDQAPVYLAEMPGATLHDPRFASLNNGEWPRGNLSWTTSPGSARRYQYNTGGTIVWGVDQAGRSVSINQNSGRNYAVPAAVTANGITTYATFDAVLNLTQTTGANSATATFTWDGMRRQRSQTLPTGQTVTHTYGLGSAPGASWHKVTTGIAPNLRWTKTVFDGFGRPLEVTTGYQVNSTETPVSKVKTEYTPCACSSIGKVLRVSMPYAANASPLHWTTYTYDAMGRTLRVTPPGNAGFTSYEYGGTTVKTIDPKGKWKKFENDALGNLIRVWEPRPGGGPDFETTYTYTLLGKLSTVTMTRPGKGLNPVTVTQVRRFTYNANGQTTSITHPENGTVSFLYNPDGTVQQKTDAKGQRTVWTYTPEGWPDTVRKFLPNPWLADGTEDTCSGVKYEYGRPSGGQSVDPTFVAANVLGRVAAVSTGCPWVRGGRIDELYSYNVAGAVLRKRMRITRGTSVVTKDIDYGYDAEGKLVSTKYPDERKPFITTYDALARPNGLTQEYRYGEWNDTELWATRAWVSGVSYGVAGELLGITTYKGAWGVYDTHITETREYNERLQLTRQRAGGVMDLRYVFTSPSSPNNDGRIIQRENVVSGETVNYTYDALQRLEKAETASAAWGLTWDYDGFGNRWEQRVTKGTAPPNTVSFDQTTNRVNAAGYAHDANGNMTAMPGVWGLAYDIDNRLVSASGNGSMEEYAYLADNKRVWKRSANQNGGTPVEQYYLYGVGGERIATYTVNQQLLNEGTLFLAANENTIDVYFGGRVIWQNGKAVLRDRLGSVMARLGDYNVLERHDYFPYGEERTPTLGDRNKYGTYHRDQTGLDYADQRYYNSTIGRFLSADPYEASGGASEPASWGRGVYVHGDPVNFLDPAGLTTCDANGNNCTDRITVTSSGMNPQTFCTMYPNNAWCRNAPIDPGDPANRLPPPKVNDPGVLRDLAKHYGKLVSSGTMTDCAALASYADFVDVFVDENLRADAFKPFLPNSFGGDGIKLEGRSGFKDRYIDIVYPEGDQVHHFAFFFSQGAMLAHEDDIEAVAVILTGGAVALEIGNWFRTFARTWKFNTPDVNLGIAAGMFGYEAARARNNQSHIAYMVRENLCK